MERATIHDFSRMCKSYKDCKFCSLSSNANELHITCFNLLANYPDKASEIILKWCEEHPIKTRQSEFMKMFPNVPTYKGVITICPCLIDCNYERKHCKNYVDFDCTDCKKDYWLVEVDDGEYNKG